MSTSTNNAPTSETPATNASTNSEPTNEELKEFFNKLVDVRPVLAAQTRRSMVLGDHYGQFSKEERTYLQHKGAMDRLHILLNPLSQNGIGLTDENATS